MTIGPLTTRGFMKISLIYILVIQILFTSCGHVRFDINGVDHEKSVVKNTPDGGCYKDTDCQDGKVCATVKGEYPGSCASTGGAGLLVGALLIGVAAAAAASDGGSEQGVSRGAAGAAPAQNSNYQGCCSYHNGVNSCGGTKILCNDGWLSGCDC